MLYEDDYLHPNNEQYDEDIYGDDNNQEEMDMYNEQYNMDDISICSTINSKKKYSKLWEDTKNIDKEYHKFVRYVNHKKYEIEAYSTPIKIGFMIRDAITGNRYKQYKVGTNNEHLFFKVKWSTGEIKNKKNEPITLFYDSPEQFERHMKVTVSQSVKEKWSRRSAEIRKIEYIEYCESKKPEFIIVK